MVIAAPTVPAWSDALSVSFGDLFFAILSPLNNFGKFLTVLLSLSVSANIAPAMYSFGMSFQVSIPILLRVPRYVFSIIGTAM